MHHLNLVMAVPDLQAGTRSVITSLVGQTVPSSAVSIHLMVPGEPQVLREELDSAFGATARRMVLHPPAPAGLDGCGRTLAGVLALLQRAYAGQFRPLERQLLVTARCGDPYPRAWLEQRYEWFIDQEAMIVADWRDGAPLLDEGMVLSVLQVHPDVRALVPGSASSADLCRQVQRLGVPVVEARGDREGEGSAWTCPLLPETTVADADSMRAHLCARLVALEALA